MIDIYMKELEAEKARAQQEKLNKLKRLTAEELEGIDKEGEAEKVRILERFNKKPPRSRQEGGRTSWVIVRALAFPFLFQESRLGRVCHLVSSLFRFCT